MDAKRYRGVDSYGKFRSDVDRPLSGWICKQNHAIKEPQTHGMFEQDSLRRSEPSSNILRSTSYMKGDTCFHGSNFTILNFVFGVDLVRAEPHPGLAASILFFQLLSITLLQREMLVWPTGHWPR